MLVICDADCKKEFDMKVEVAPVEAKKEATVEKVFLKCPYCGHEYISHYSDNEVKRLQKQIKEVGKKVGNKKFDQKILAVRKREIEGKLKAKMDELKERYGE